MLPPDPGPAPSKIAGLVFLLFGIFALFVAGFVWIFSSNMDYNIRLMFFSFLSLY
jgi:hypothetical protein